jgi:hypothetical protein
MSIEAVAVVLVMLAMGWIAVDMVITAMRIIQWRGLLDWEMWVSVLLLGVVCGFIWVMMKLGEIVGGDW